MGEDFQMLLVLAHSLPCSRAALALAAGKCVYHGMRLLGRQASYLPGWFAVRLCPDFLRQIRKAQTVICVTGTDGKTTTANLLSDLLTACGKTVANNRIGSNTEYGIATAMILSVSLRNRCPTWDEMCLVKDIFWQDDECVVQFHPPKSEYVNLHPYCLHLWKKICGTFETPPKIFV